MKKIVKIISVLFGALILIIFLFDVCGYLSGRYVKTKATVTHVNEYTNGVITKTYQRTNGDIEWEWNNQVFQNENRVDFPSNTQIGDTKEIWIDSNTGEYLAVQGLGKCVFGYLLYLSACICTFLWSDCKSKNVNRRTKK